MEVDKEIFSPRQNNLREGDPDFENDASRLLLSQKTNGDANFGLEFPKLNGGETIDPISDDAYAILKSNQIRILARKSEETGEIGSIKIQKEGEEDEDRISIILDGNTIFLEGRKIIIGSGIGAIVLRQLTISNIDRVKKYIYLKNGAMYSIFFLGLIMILHAFGFHIPEWLSPIITIFVVVYFYWKSKLHLANQTQTTTI